MWKIVAIFLSAVLAVGASTMVGGFKDIDVHNGGVQNALNFAVVQHNRGTNDIYLRQAFKVVKAQVQVVAGLKYVLTVEMVKTGCRKNDELCSSKSLPANAGSYQCEFTVWDRPWMNEISLLDEKC